MADKEQSPAYGGIAGRTAQPRAGVTEPAGPREPRVTGARWHGNTLSGLESRAGNIERLKQTIAELEAEKARLTAEHRHELDARKAELLQLQAAYDQFEQQSDQLLAELEQQNERLRDECRRQNRRSLL